MVRVEIKVVNSIVRTWHKASSQYHAISKRKTQGRTISGAYPKRLTDMKESAYTDEKLQGHIQ